MPPATALASAKLAGPVIGGETSLGTSPPPPPTVVVSKGPGAGNASALVLILVVCGAIATAVFFKLRKMHEKSSLHKKGLQMAHELKAAANAKPPKKEKPTKALPGSKGGAQFTQLLQADDDEQDVEGGGSEPEDGEEAFSDLAPAAGAKKKKESKASRDKDTKAMKTHEEASSSIGLRFGAAPPPGENEDAESAVTCDFGGDDESAIDFNEDMDEDTPPQEKPKRRGKPPPAKQQPRQRNKQPPALRETPRWEDSQEDQRRTGDDGDIGDDFLFEHAEEEDDEDDIGPNDSVSNIGFSKALHPPKSFESRPSRGAGGRPSRREKGAKGCRAMPSLVEQRSVEGGKTSSSSPRAASERSPRKGRTASSSEGGGGRGGESTSPTGFLTLEDGLPQLSSRPPPRGQSHDDAFSVVHDDLLAMRKGLPGFEMQIDLAQKQQPAKKSGGSSKPRAPQPRCDVSLQDDDGSDAGSDLTFMGGGAAPGGGGEGRARATTLLPPDDDSDAGSAVTFNFDTHAAPAGCSGLRAKGEASSKGARPRAAAAAPKPLPGPKKRGLRHPNREPEDRTNELILGGHDEDAEAADDNDDSFTSVGLSAAGPRDPYLGLRATRVVGGGQIGPCGEWTMGGGRPRGGSKAPDVI